MNYEEVKQKYAGAIAEKKKQLARIDRRIELATQMLEEFRNTIRDYGIIIKAEDQPGLDFAKQKVSSLQKQIENLSSERLAITMHEADKQLVFKSIGL